MVNVVMYGTQSCPYCVAARRLLANKGVEYEDIRVDMHPERRAEMQRKGGGHTVPQRHQPLLRGRQLLLCPIRKQRDGEPRSSARRLAPVGATASVVRRCRALCSAAAGY